MNVQAVSEFPTTAPEQIEHFARLLRKSEQRRWVFKEIYRGKAKKPKTAAAIGDEVGLTAKRVLEIATPLAANHLFEQTKADNLTAYKKYSAINCTRPVDR